MSFNTIRHAQKEIWPSVLKSIKLIQASRDAVRKDPHSATRAATTRAHRPWNQVVANEAVWAIAKADLLCTPEQQAVVKAAREWAKMIGPDLAKYPQDYEPEDFALRDAVNSLALSFTASEDEELHITPESVTVDSANKN